MLDDKEIDAIIIAVPDHWHKQVVVDAVGAGKDVYCEKPMSHSAADGVAMVAAVENRSHHADRRARTSSVLCAKAKELIASGAIGELSLIEGSRDATILREPGNIRRRQTYRPRIWIGTPGWARRRKNRSILICSRAGAAGRSTEPG